jgi:hypothetical protein
MSVHYEAGRDRYAVRWREAGRNRSRRFATLSEAEAFDAARLAPVSSSPLRCRPGVGPGAMRSIRTRRAPGSANASRSSSRTERCRRGAGSRAAAPRPRRGACSSSRSSAAQSRWRARHSAPSGRGSWTSGARSDQGLDCRSRVARAEAAVARLRLDPAGAARRDGRSASGHAFDQRLRRPTGCRHAHCRSDRRVSRRRIGTGATAAWSRSGRAAPRWLASRRPDMRA